LGRLTLFTSRQSQIPQKLESSLGLPVQFFVGSLFLFQMSEPHLARMLTSYICNLGVISHERPNCAEVRHHETCVHIYIFSASPLPPSVFEVSSNRKLK
jgi:hypothetical protein